MIAKLSGVVLTTLLLAASVAAQTDATVQLRDGSKVNGRIEELTGGTLYARLSQPDQRQIPIGNVALIDRVGGASGLPATELREAAGDEHLLLLSNGSSVKGRLVAIRGGRGSAQGNDPRTYVFQTIFLLALVICALPLGAVGPALSMLIHAAAAAALVVAVRQALDTDTRRALIVCAFAIVLGLALLSLLGVCYGDPPPDPTGFADRT